MVDQNLLSAIENYLTKNFTDFSWIEEARKNGYNFSVKLESKKFGEPSKLVSKIEKIVEDLKDKIGISRTCFSDYLSKIIEDKNFTDVEVYKKAHLDRRIFSKIRNEKDYMPSKKTVITIAIALELNLKETNALLSRAGYCLTSARKEDVIVAYFIENQNYDLFLINEVLDYYECSTLGC